MSEDQKLPPQTVELGWGRTPFVEQFRGLASQEGLEHFDQDADAIDRLKIRGYLTQGQRGAIVKKLCKAIGKAIKGGAS